MVAASQKNAIEYMDFDLEIGQGDGNTYPVALLESPSGETRGVMHWPYDAINLKLHLTELENVLLRSATTRRVATTDDEQTVEQFGSTLFNALFDDEVRNRFEVSLERARMQGKGLRIKLRILAPELAALPWEFMYDLQRSEYLCFSRQTPIVRYPSLPISIEPMEVSPPLRILGMVASPRNLPALDVNSEKKRLSQPLEALQKSGIVELHWLEGQTWRDLQRALRQGPWHVFHFIGHGGFDSQREEGFLALSDENGERDDLRATQLARLVADHAPMRLVVLNACEGGRSSQEDIFSSSASILLRGGVPAVLAMQYAITDQAAVEFARTFYEALADGVPVDTAVAEGRLAINLAFEDTIEWGTPVLYLRAEDGVLFNVNKPFPQQLGNQQPKPVEALPSFAGEQTVVEMPQPARSSVIQKILENLKSAQRRRITGVAGIMLLFLIVAIASGGAQRALSFLSQPPTATVTLAAPSTVSISQAQAEPTNKATQTQAVAVPPSSTITASAEPSATLEAPFTPTFTSLPAILPTETPTSSGESVLGPGFIQKSEKDGMAMVYIPEGNFDMGCDMDNPFENCDGNNTLHNVRLDAFWIDQTNVTNAMYARCVDDGWCSTPASNRSLTREDYYTDPQFKDYPVIYVTWDQASEYCAWAGRRMPTEAEWEKAARGDMDTRRFPWGNEEPTCEIANFSPGIDCTGDTSSTSDQKYLAGASPYGVLDMAGNIWDWVNDFYDAGYYRGFEKVNPQGPASGNYKVMRGGCFINASHSLRVAFRGRREPAAFAWDVGIRCAATP